MIDIREAKKVIITKHAKSRALARARLVLNEVQISNIEAFIELDFKRSLVNRKEELVPFYHNKLWAKHGACSYISSSKIFKFCFSYENDIAVIKTVIYLHN